MHDWGYQDTKQTLEQLEIVGNVDGHFVWCCKYLLLLLRPPELKTCSRLHLRSDVKPGTRKRSLVLAIFLLILTVK